MGSSILLPIYRLWKIFVTREEPGGPGERLSCAVERFMSSVCLEQGRREEAGIVFRWFQEVCLQAGQPERLPILLH